MFDEILKDDFIKAIKENQILIVIGGTSSNKTIKMVNYLAKTDFLDNGIIGLTYPKRISVKTNAKKVSKEQGYELGQEVGYQIRFDNKTSSKTRIKFMTQGILLREYLNNNVLASYSIIIFDETYDRTINLDVLLGLLKKALLERPSLKIIVITNEFHQTMDFSKYLCNAPSIEIPETNFEVHIEYENYDLTSNSDLQKIIEKVEKIHMNERAGDILVFLTGHDKVYQVACSLKKRMQENKKQPVDRKISEMFIQEVYSSKLLGNNQVKALNPTPPGCRSIILATNCIETSLKIDNIVYVVDPGLIKLNIYEPKTQTDTVRIIRIDKATADRRADIAGIRGRNGHGKCYRLYKKETYDSMKPNAVPEIIRNNLACTVLQLKVAGVNDNLLDLQLIDEPSRESYTQAIILLKLLEAIDNNKVVTDLGRKMNKFPLAPHLSKMLIESVEKGCSNEILTIICMLTVPNIFKKMNWKKKATKKTNEIIKGDHLNLLFVYNEWEKSNYSENWCKENNVRSDFLNNVWYKREQLVKLMKKQKLQINSANENIELVQEVLCKGFFKNIAKSDGSEAYRLLSIDNCKRSCDKDLYIHPTSILYDNLIHSWVIYYVLSEEQEVEEPRRTYMKYVTEIKKEWIDELTRKFRNFQF